MEQKMGAKFERLATQNQQEAAKFLAENAKREGVQTTTSGLQFRVVKQGTGASPTINDRVRCHYRGTLLNGTEFDSSANQGGPAEFAVAEVIPGWTEALQKMRVGDKWQLFVPPDLAYGMNPHPSSGLEPNSLLVFDIELLEVLPQ
jgi:FKBP-type peptidyl-prolyl cis-trans isomerase FklB